MLERLDLARARVHQVVVDGQIGLEQVGFDAARWLNRHLAAVLQDHDGKLGTRHASQPEAEVFVHVFGVDLLDESFERGHPTGGQVAVLEKHPQAAFHRRARHRLGSRTLTLSERDRRELFRELHLVGELVQVGRRIGALREHEYERRRWRRVLVDEIQLGCLWLDESLTDVLGDEILHGVCHLVGSQAFENDDALE